ncbi:MAG: porin family protein [Bacteroidota bacterium]
MKKLILFLLILLSAQLMYGKFHLGIKVGYNASKLSINIDTVTSSFKSGFQFGAFARIGNRFYVQPEVYYTTQGGVFTSNISNWKQNVKIGSIDVPLLLGFQIIKGDFANLRILAGPAASFVVNKSISEGGTSTGPLTSGNLKSVNWSIQAGAGVDVWMLTLDVRYQIGLNQLIQNVQDYKFESKNNVWVISLGIKIF